MQFLTFFKIKQYQLFPVISMHVEKQCSSPLSYWITACSAHTYVKPKNKRSVVYTVELQSVEDLGNQENMFETRVVRANDYLS